MTKPWLSSVLGREQWWRRRESKANRDTASPREILAENRADPQPKPSEPTAPANDSPSLETLRTKLDAAIVAERWDAVAAIRARIVELERASVIDLAAVRAKRGAK
jgi:hypothetical protein